MRKVLFAVFLVLTMAQPVNASEIVAPEVQISGRQLMPQNTDSFGAGLLELLRNSIQLVRPDLQEASQFCGTVVFSAMLFSVLPMISPRLERAAAVSCTVSIAAVMFRQTNSMILLATDTVRDILDYGKLLCQVMTAALAAQGGATESSALYIGTTLFITILNALISRIMIPMLFFYLAFSVAFGALGDDFLKKTAEMIKSALVWSLKLLLIVFTTYMSITGAVSGATDLAALKTAKVVISSAVPVVGGILSDSSEAVLVSMGVIKNAAGIYGMLAVLSVFMGPFIKIGMHYLLLKLSAVLCGVFGDKQVSAIAECFLTAMSLLLSAIAAGCVLVLISTVCFLKGAG